MKKYFLALFILLLLPAFASADLTTNMRAYYSFDSSLVLDDYTGTYNATNNGASTVTGKLNNAADFEDSESDYIITNAEGSWVNSAWSVSYWVKMEDYSTYNFAFSAGDDTSGSEEFWASGVQGNGSLSTYAYDRPTTLNEVYSGVDVSADTSWHHIVAVYASDGSTNAFYVDNVDYGSDAGAMTAASSYFAYIGATSWNAGPLNHWDGLIDEVGIWEKELNSTEVDLLYNSGDGCNPVDNPTGCTVSGNATERLQQNAKVYQNGTVTVNSVNYVLISTASFTLTDDALVYGTSPVVIEPSASNTATCRIEIDGVELNNSESSRSLTAGDTGVLLLNSLPKSLTAGTYNTELECKRTGGGAFDVTGSVINLNVMTSKNGETLQYQDYNLTGSGTGIVFNDTFTTSTNSTEADLQRALVLEMSLSIDYSATGNLTFTPEIAGTNCTPITRYGAIGSTGSSAAVCEVSGLNNDTTYDFKIHTSGVATTLTGTGHLKEFILHEGEINSTSLNGISITGDNQSLASVDITISAGHTNPNIITETIIDVVSTNGSQTPVFYIEHEGETSINVSRTVNEGQAGTLGLEQLFQGASVGTETSTLYGYCFGCELQGGDMVAFISNDVAATPNGFTIQAQNIYDNSTISEFSVNLSDGRTLSTTTGSLTVPAEEGLLNITVLENPNAAIPYFTNSTTAHNVSNDLTINLTPYTLINATYIGVKVNNFTVNSTITTTGKVYVRLFNETITVNLTNATAEDSTSLADQTQNISSISYLQNYTFELLTSNAFNFSIYDELTEQLITQNITLELISDSTATTYTTTNGTLYIELLTPQDYNIRYRSTTGNNYTERDYYLTLVDKQRYDIELYSLNLSEATDTVITIKDTAGDKVEAATVKLLRYYASCNCYPVVEMAKTDVNGEAYFISDAYDGHYKLSVDYQGVNRFISTEPSNFVPTSGLITRTININLGSAYFQSFRELTNIGRSLVVNNETGALTFSWSDPSDTVTRGCLYASYIEGVTYTDLTPACQNSSTGSVYLILNDTNKTYKYYAEVETSTTYSEYTFFSGFIDKVRTSLFSDVKFGGFLGGLFVVVMAIMFSFSAIAVMISTSITIIALSFLGAFTFSTAFITGFVALSIGIAIYGMRS